MSTIEQLIDELIVEAQKNNETDNRDALARAKAALLKAVDQAVSRATVRGTSGVRGRWR